MRRSGLMVSALSLCAAACSQQSSSSDEQVSHDLAEAPDVSPTAAPGVAFRYLYQFELPDEAIAGVQEKHASRCEGLGVARCRITGLEYSVLEGDAVTASLTVKLAPEIARQFGKEAANVVTGENGRLRKTEFTGEDTEPVTTSASREQSTIEARITELERQLAATTKDAERAQLQSQLSEMRSRLAAARSTIADTQQRLASTPMTFHYYGRGGIQGFQTNPVREALRSFVDSTVLMITFVLQLLAYLLPWALLLALLLLVYRSRPGQAVRRFVAKRTAPISGDEEAAG